MHFHEYINPSWGLNYPMRVCLCRFNKTDKIWCLLWSQGKRSLTDINIFPDLKSDIQPHHAYIYLFEMNESYIFYPHTKFLSIRLHPYSPVSRERPVFVLAYYHHHHSNKFFTILHSDSQFEISTKKKKKKILAYF